MRTWPALGAGTPQVRAWVRMCRRREPAARPAFALAAGLATLLVTVIV